MKINKVEQLKVVQFEMSYLEDFKGANQGEVEPCAITKIIAMTTRRVQYRRRVTYETHFT